MESKDSKPASDAKPRAVFRGKDTLGKNHEQSILNILRMVCSEAIRNPDFGERLQMIKKLFYNRDFDGIFLQPENLPVYTAQYVPRRALCYYEIFSAPELQQILQKRPTVYCLGAGSGSELLGISAASCRALEDGGSDKGDVPITIHSQDYADWSPILNSLENAIRYKWGIEEKHVRYEFSVGDLLCITPEIEAQIARAQLVTVMFVFNELFSDKTNVMNFVRAMVKNLRKGSHFLLVDSAGSFSSVKVGNRDYMSYMFFDSLTQHFAPVISHDSRWFRHSQGLEYPLGIENMRYFLRLYQKK
ncbi:hypothetical protein LPJ56_000484 [Coemansia sp. RSA 2599]|nr:hypothetical protein LPJ75_000202 [Coemansia sp. RSA 2598]KAJ1829243.1 hypothetical protein LPJ56_000484 [Coemansia sp. RSA 2599]